MDEQNIGEDSFKARSTTVDLGKPCAYCNAVNMVGSNFITRDQLEFCS